MGGLAGGMAALILLGVVLRRAPAKFAGNVLGPATTWLRDWTDPAVPLIRPRHQPPASAAGQIV